VVAATVADDLLQPSVLSHERSLVVYAAGVLLAAALLALTPRIGSRLLSLGSGLASGGALATVVCGIAWRGGVPNPLTRGDVAFNLADLAIALGVVLLIGGALLHGWLERDRLFESVDATRRSQ
jgi:lipoprotein signal peptidase